MIDSLNILETYVVFRPSHFFWLNKILKRNFGHCYLLLKSALAWYKLEGNIEGIYLYPLTHDANFALTDNLPNDHIVIKAAKQKGMRGICCVKTVKQYLGIDDPFILTPHQLFKYLSKKNKTLKFGF